MSPRRCRASSRPRPGRWGARLGLVTMVMLDQELVPPEHLSRLPVLCRARWDGRVVASLEDAGRLCRIECRPGELREICEWLMRELRFTFATLVVEEEPAWSLVYVF